MSESAGDGRICPRCGRENAADAENCIRCGIDLNEPYEAAAEPEAPSAFCFRHPKVATNLSCGRCERPICTKCAVIGPNGIRCRECAQQKIAIRPGAVVHEVKRGVFAIAFSSPWSLWILVTVIGSLFWTIRSCAADRHESRRPPPIERESE